MLLPHRDTAPSDAMGHCVHDGVVRWVDFANGLYGMGRVCIWPGEVLCVVWPGMVKTGIHTLGKAMHNEYYGKQYTLYLFHPYRHTHTHSYLYICMF